MVELVIANIMSRANDDRAYVLMLQERNGFRRIILALGNSETNSIAMSLRKAHSPRPLTHELFGSLARAFDIKMRYVIINRIEEGTFCSTILFEQGNEVREIDARTSDAVALALRSGAPILITEELLNRTCVRDAPNGAVSIPIHAANDKVLRDALAEAIRNEDYEFAKTLKDELDSRHSNLAENNINN